MQQRAVDFGFFDFSTLDARRRDCEDEITLTRRLAPDVYRGFVPVFHDDHGYSFTRVVDVSDYAVHMTRLPIEARADHLLRRGRLSTKALEQLARYVVPFYRTRRSA